MTGAAGLRGRPLALKLFNCDVPQQRIVDEKTFAGSVHHPGIVCLDACNQWADGRYYITFDWVSERSLRDEIDGGVRPDTDQFARGAEQLLEAVDCLHQNEREALLHNDIKPENILIGQGGRFVLVDFGSASPPRVSSYEGTEGYVAPDLRLGLDRQYSIDGDLYAVAVTLHEWLFL